MQRVEKTVDTGLLLEEYRTLLEAVDQLPLTITGSSMTCNIKSIRIVGNIHSRSFSELFIRHLT